MNVTDKNSAINGMNKMFYYAMNIPFIQTTYSMPWDDNETKTEWLPNFVEGVAWTCNKAHIVGLWKDASDQGGYFGKFMAFYSYLDTYNRKALLDYICETYNDEVPLYK